MNDFNGTPEQELLSLEAAAEFLCVSKSTLYRLLGQGKLHGMKAGKQWRFRKEDLVAYMQRGPAALALANLPMAVLEAELAALAEAFAAAGASTEKSDDPSLTGEGGKIRQMVRRMAWLLHALGGSDIHLEPAWEAGAGYCDCACESTGRCERCAASPSLSPNRWCSPGSRRPGWPWRSRGGPRTGWRI